MLQKSRQLSSNPEPGTIGGTIDGTATIIGMIPMGTRVELHGPEFLMERKMQGSNRFRVDMRRFVELYLQGRLHLDDLLSK